jgi:hypothetical protein
VYRAQSGDLMYAWIDVYVSRLDAPDPWKPRRVACIYTDVLVQQEQTPISGVILFSGAPGDTVHPQPHALALALLPTSLLVVRNANQRLDVARRRLDVIFRDDSHGSVSFETQLAAPLAPDDELQLRFEYRAAYQAPIAGTHGWQFQCNITCSRYTVSGNSQRGMLQHLGVQRATDAWYALSGEQAAPSMLQAAKVDPPLTSAAIVGQGKRSLRIVRARPGAVNSAVLDTTADDVPLYTLVHAAEVPAWRTGSSTPALWPFAIQPAGTTATEEFREVFTRDFQAYALAHHVVSDKPRASWRVDALWSSAAGTTPPERAPLGAWRKIVEAHHGALSGVVTNTAVSGLPRLGIESPQTQHWRLSYQLEAAPQRWRITRTRLRPGRAERLSLRSMTPGAAVHDEFEVNGWLDAFRAHGGGGLSRRYRLAALTHDDGDWLPSVSDEIVAPAPTLGAGLDLDQPGEYHVAFKLYGIVDDVAGPTSTLHRIGALDVTVTSTPRSTPVRVMASGDRFWDGGRPRTVWMRMRDLELEVTEITPSDQDVTEAEALTTRASEPSGLMIVKPDTDVESDAGSSGGRPPKYILTFDERASQTDDRHLTLTLERDQAADAQRATPKHVFMLDDAPFLVARVDVDPSKITSGVWESRGLEGAAWHIVDEGKPAQIQLPPAVVGEPMIKRHRDQSPPTGNAALAFKLAPTSRLRLKRSALETAGGEPPWNLRRLFGWPGQRAAGSLLEHLQLELLYGLTTTVDASGLRLVELAAAMGVPRPMRALPDGRGSTAYLEYHERILDNTRSRPSFVYVAPASQHEQRATISDGVHFRLRRTREVEHPIDASETAAPLGIGAPIRYFTHADGGLRGGVDWGFESRNIYEQVLRLPSTGGRLVAPALTPLGGFGFQKATFANELTNIYSDTALGHTTYYALERFGRIAVLWHPAKHVIIYERTVAASEQFPDQLDSQATKPKSVWGQRPVVRKIEEYVELLDPHRSYPDDEAPAASRGFVLGAKFMDRRIPVDSAWGSDIRGGWIVPLHRSTLSDQDAKIYPRPDVRLQLATAVEPAWGAIRNPHDLYFYTPTTDDAGRDPAVWPPVPGLDFPMEDLPVLGGAPSHADDKQLPDAPSQALGYERFTFDLEPLSARIDLAAARSERTIEAALENVTLARRGLQSAAAVGWQTVDRVAAQALAARTQIDSYRRAVEEYAAAAIGELGDAVTARLVDLAAAVESARTQAREALGDVEKIETRLRQRQDALLADWKANRERVVEQVSNQLVVEIQAGVDVDAVKARVREIGRAVVAVGTIADELQPRVRQALAAIEHWNSSQARLAREWSKRLADAQALVQNRGATLLHELLALHDTVRAGQRALQTQLAGFAHTATLIVVDQASARIGAEIERFTTKIDDYGHRIDEWASSIRIDEVIAAALPIGALGAVETELKALATALPDPKDLIAALKEKAAALLDNNAALVARVIATAKDGVDAVKAELSHDFDAAVTNVAQEIERHATAELRKLVADAMGPLEAASDAKALTDLVAHARSLAVRVPEAREIVNAALRRTGDELRRQLDVHASHTEHILTQVAERIGAAGAQLGDRTMRLVRAFGAAPVAQSLQLNRDRVAYMFHEAVGEGRAALSRLVGLTPSTVLLNRLGREVPNLDLKTLGIQLPTFSLGDRFIPDLRQALDLGRLFPDFAGLSLDGLFRNVQFPSLSADGISVKHGVDPKTRSAWAEADVVFPIRDAVVFSVGPFVLRLANAKFEAHTRIDADTSGVHRNVDGKIRGDFRFEIAGTELVALNRSELKFDNSGKLTFRISPQGITVHQAMQFLTKLLQYAPSGNGTGLTIAPISPAGMRVSLNVALPTIQTGAFSISNLALSTFFELAVRDGFELAAGFGFASEDRPFNLSVLFLGGGGWFTTGVRYAPFSSSPPRAMVYIGLAVGASLPFDIGVARGGVWLLLSAAVRWQSGQHFELILALTLRGEVVLLGIVSVGLYLRLEVVYINGGAGMHCSGYMSISIKLGPFFKIKVEHRVTFQLTGSGGQPSGGTDAVERYANGYEE